MSRDFSYEQEMLLIGPDEHHGDDDGGNVGDGDGDGSDEVVAMDGIGPWR